MEKAGPEGCRLMLPRGVAAAKQRSGDTSTQNSRSGHCVKAATWPPGPETQGTSPFFKDSASFQEQELILIREQGNTFHYVRGEGQEEGGHSSSLWPRDGGTKASVLRRSRGKPGFPQRERKNWRRGCRAPREEEGVWQRGLPRGKGRR